MCMGFWHNACQYRRYRKHRGCIDGFFAIGRDFSHNGGTCALDDFDAAFPPFRFAHPRPLIGYLRGGRRMLARKGARMKPTSRVSRLYEVMDLMLDSVGDPLALKNLAASASYSSFHFDRIFRELTGFSAVEYQRKRRLRRAAHLLRHEPDVSILRIAQDLSLIHI